MTDSKNIFIWKNFTEWKPVLEKMFPDILTDEFIDKIKQNKNLIKYHDDPIFDELANKEMDSIVTYKKIVEFRRHYSHIRMYHGCRPVDVQRYYREGIKPCEEMGNIQIDRFREIFLSDDFPELTEEMLQESIKIINNPPPDTGVHFIIDDNCMIERCGHYLIYGSEYLQGLVNNLPVKDKEKYRSVLRGIGKPTFLEVNLPNTNDFVEDIRIFKILDRMLRLWVYNIAHNGTTSGDFYYGTVIMKELQPEYICSDYHPKKIKDSLMGNKYYNTETGEYTESK
ncbi:MAG: hypothetical protein JXA96_14915 [Sedimentisphaerales bacterium]|nr:hypothetical protein [Sedimentisphaerales bacterium]